MGLTRLAGSILSYRAHTCAFFNSTEDAYRVLTPFIEEGLECGEKAVHTIDPHRRDEHMQRLALAGIISLPLRRMTSSSCVTGPTRI